MLSTDNLLCSFCVFACLIYVEILPSYENRGEPLTSWKFLGNSLSWIKVLSDSSSSFILDRSIGLGESTGFRTLFLLTSSFLFSFIELVLRSLHIDSLKLFLKPGD
ncbi:hypothetical protein MA16_Dca018743 [Dendrobium catenatum]|uniref:Uncharacterized protein n=1 Tax=Dendrobium catenatum TaxID=906689 RepID=A0A2I0VUC4_9ASPA|nr:hypothetical protein MA16_Dca018743 [Dendrobium catenatum]